MTAAKTPAPSGAPSVSSLGQLRERDGVFLGEEEGDRLIACLAHRGVDVDGGVSPPISMVGCSGPNPNRLEVPVGYPANGSMSKDFQIGHTCPHVIGEERTTLSADRMTLTTQKPIAGTGLLELRLNDQYIVSPTTGVRSSAVLSSSKAQPYLVSPGLTDFVIRTQARTLSLSLPTGYLPAERVSSIINTAVYDASERPYLVSSVKDGVLVLTENRASGSESQVRVSGNAKEGLGFLEQVGAVGQVVLPSFNLYSISYQAEENLVQEGYFVRFDRPVRPNYYFSLTYSVFWNQCLRCRGTEVENDFRFGDEGAPLIIRNENLLYQSCLKIVLTELKSNIYYPWYGANLMSLIGSKSNAASAANIQQSIREALRNLQGQQALQSKYQKISPKERLYSVDNVGVRPSANDPTVFLVDVTVRNFAMDPVELSIVYTAPGAYALPGTNGLSLGSF